MKQFNYPPDPEDDDYDSYGVWKGEKDYSGMGICIAIIVVIVVFLIF